jgi:small basic protein (TIGR04137 family)
VSVHPSLRISGLGKQQRSVLKRIERIKYLQEKGLWHETSSVFGLPKIKTVRLKIKKEKAEKAAAETTSATATTPPASEGSASTKASTGAKASTK